MEATQILQLILFISWTISTLLFGLYLPLQLQNAVVVPGSCSLMGNTTFGSSLTQFECLMSVKNQPPLPGGVTVSLVTKKTSKKYRDRWYILWNSAYPWTHVPSLWKCNITPVKDNHLPGICSLLKTTVW